MPAAQAPPPVSFRPLGEADLPTLHRWLNTPHVLEWWDRPGPTLDEVRTKYLPRAGDASDVEPYIVRLGRTSIGYIQLYRIPGAAWGRSDLGAGVGIDLFLGESRSLHRGLGPRVLRAFLHDIVFRDETTEACFIDPSPRNRIAIRAFEKAGFRPVGAATDPDSGLEVWLMRITRQEFEAGGS